MLKYSYEDIKNKSLKDLANKFGINIEEEPIGETFDVNYATFLKVDDNNIRSKFQIDFIGELEYDSLTRSSIYFVKGLEALKPIIKKRSTDSKDANSIRFDSHNMLRLQITLSASTMKELVEKLLSFFREWYTESIKQTEAFEKEFNLH